MKYAIFDLRNILMQKSCVEEFGKDLLLYKVRKGSYDALRTLVSGFASCTSKVFGNGYAYLFAGNAFRGVPKRLVEQYNEEYRKLIPDVSKKVVRSIMDQGIGVGVITHDIHSLIGGVCDELGVDPRYVKDNDFSFDGGCVSGIVRHENGWPRVHEKMDALMELLSEKNIPENRVVLIGHGPEELGMARTLEKYTRTSRILVPEKGSCKELKRISAGVYKHLESLPRMIDVFFNGVDSSKARRLGSVDLRHMSYTLEGQIVC